MGRCKGIVCALCATALLPACLSYPATSDRAAIPTVVEVPASEGETALARLVQFIERVRREPPARQRAEYVAAREAHARAPDPVTRLRLAALLRMPNAPFRDDDSALALLRTGAADRNAWPPLRAAAALWLRELEERMALERALEEERRQRQELEGKMKQLKAIEEEIYRRQAPPLVPKR